MPKIGSDQLAPHCSVEEGPTGLELSWPGGRATFQADDKGRQQLLTFSVVVTAELDEVSASYRHPNGEPLFDLGRLDGPGPAPL